MGTCFLSSSVSILMLAGLEAHCDGQQIETKEDDARSVTSWRINLLLQALIKKRAIRWSEAEALDRSLIRALQARVNRHQQTWHSFSFILEHLIREEKRNVLEDNEGNEVKVCWRTWHNLSGFNSLSSNASIIFLSHIQLILNERKCWH